MSKIKFSVLMSVYKSDKTEYVKVAIDSVLNQTLRPDQYVIMIDGPISEDLKQILLDYEKKDKIVELHFRDKNLGLGLTLNEGLNYCKYDYVARMDADDKSSPNRFEKQIKYLEKHPETDIIGTNLIEYDGNLSKIISQKNVPETDDELKKYIKYRNPINHPTVIFNKNKVINVGSYEDYPLFEDYYLWAKLVADDCKFYNIQQPLYNFRGGDSMYGRRGGKKYLNCIKKFERGLLNLGIINKKEYYKNISKRYIGALMPNKLRGFLYKRILRDRSGDNDKKNSLSN